MAVQRDGDSQRLHTMYTGAEHEDIERRLARTLADRGDDGSGVTPAGVQERAAVLRRRRAGVVSGFAALALALPVGLGIDALQGGPAEQVAAPTPRPSSAEPEQSSPAVPPLDRGADGLLVVPQAIGDALSGAVPGGEYYGYLPFPSGAFLQNVVAACMEHTPAPVEAIGDGGGSWTYVLDEEERGQLYGSADVRVDLYAADGAVQQTDYLRERAGDCAEVMDLEVAEPAPEEEAGLEAAGAEDGSAVVVVGAEPAQLGFEVDDPARAGALAVAVVDSVQVRVAVSRRGDGTGPEVRERVRAESLALLTAAVAEVVAADVPARAEASR